MKIVLIGAHFPPEFTGGSEMVLEAHARELVKLGCEVRVISGTSEPWDGREVRRETRDELEILRLARTPEECSSLDWNRPRIAALVERETRDADLVHVHHWLGLSGEVIDSPFLPICRSQLNCRLNAPDQRVAEDMRGFHWMMVYGDYLRETGYAVKKTGIQWECLG